MTAAIAQRNGWGVGTLLVGDEGYGPTVIRITAIGETQLLAVAVTHNGMPPRICHEGVWTLEYRDWQRYEEAAA